MTFTATDGTRGARQPGNGRVLRWMNRAMMGVLRRTNGRFGKIDALVLTTVGRKSGQPRSTPVGYFTDGPDAWLIVASAAGAPNNPAWYHNIAAHPDQVRIEIGALHVDVSAEQLHGHARTNAWRTLIAAAPQFGKYERKTDREIPVIRLTRRSATGASTESEGI